MKHRLFLAAALAVTVLSVQEADSQLNANPTIPQHLLPCYRNPELYTRENRLPSKFRLFIDLLKKVERSRGGQQKSARDLSMALLYHLRLDGIQPTPNVQQTKDVTPFAPGGNNYYKHRLTLVGLLPKPSRPVNYELFNESLTEYEMCNLHFMLSYSIDPYKRENEDCSAIKLEDANRYIQGYGSGYYDHRYDSSRRYQSYRHKRQSDASGHARAWSGRAERRRRHIQARIRNLRRSLRNERGDGHVEGRFKRSSVDREENLRHPDVEMIPVHVLDALSKSNNGSVTKIKKEEFTLGHQDFLGPGEDHIMRGGYGRAPLPRANEGALYKRTASYYGETSRVLIPGQQLSDCPIENGVLHSKYGSLTIGTVISGIAAGFNFQRLPLSDFNAEIKGPLGAEKINNIWATTLAGNAADLILSLGLVKNLREGVGLRGGWNSLGCPKWYMLEKGTPNYLTDVELRGALDGLWLGLTVEKWSKLLSAYPLSSILELYYSDDGFVFDDRVKASRRGDEVTQYAPTEEFRTQLHLLSVVMKNQRVNTVTYSDFTNAVSDTVSAVNSYIPQLSARHSTLSTSSQSRSNIDQKIDLAVVFDPAWGLPSLNYYIRTLIDEELGATLGQSNLTLICPFDTTMVYPVPDSLTFWQHFEEIFNDCASKRQNMNYKLMFQQVSNYFARSLKEENFQRRIISYSHVALLMISDTQPTPDPSMATEEMQRVLEYIPGLQILLATNGRKEKFRDLVVSPEIDIFTLKIQTDEPTTIDEDTSQLLNRIARVPRRLSNPASANRMDNATFFEGDSELNDDVRRGRTALYRIDPYYLYDSKDVKLSVRTKGYTITVCHAREQNMLPPFMQRSFNAPYPESGIPDVPGNGDDDSTGQRNCQKGSSVMFDFENLCEDADSVKDCKPLYVTIQAPLESKSDIRCVNCRFPTNVECDIKVSGLAGGGAATVVISTSLLVLSWVLTLLASNL